LIAVLDASAVLALLFREPGHDQVAELLDQAAISTVNWAEVVRKLNQRGHPAPITATEGLRSLGVAVLPFTVDDANRAALLWHATRQAGLSLGDRSCLAVTAGIAEGVAVTADRAWTTLGLDIPMRLIR
jgi:ribonuclease VapC